MTFSRSRLLLLVLGSSLLVGCSALLETHSQQAPDASFARRSTFRFLPDQSAPTATSNYWRGEIGQALLSALNAKGYRFFPNRRTDFLVAYPEEDRPGHEQCGHALVGLSFTPVTTAIAERDVAAQGADVQRDAAASGESGRVAPDQGDRGV